jgi:hypothetical protein
MGPNSHPQRADILSADEEGVLCVLREIVAGLRERGIALGLDSFEAAILAAGATRAQAPGEAGLRAYGFGGVRFTARAAEPGTDGVEVCFLSDWR